MDERPFPRIYNEDYAMYPEAKYKPWMVLVAVAFVFGALVACAFAVGPGPKEKTLEKELGLVTWQLKLAREENENLNSILAYYSGSICLTRSEYFELLSRPVTPDDCDDSDLKKRLVPVPDPNFDQGQIGQEDEASTPIDLKLIH